jgi:hypothetical protein
LWGNKNERKKVHWLAWDKLTKLKLRGGTGFKDLELFNQALLARQVWRLLQYLNSLSAVLLEAKYYPHGDLLDTSFARNSSPVWKGIEHGLDLLKKGVIWRVNSGHSINIWRDNWIPRSDSLKISSPTKRCRLRRVADLMLQNPRCWNEPLIRQTFLFHEAEEILGIRIPEIEDVDILAWHFEKNSIFSVRSASKLAVEDISPECCGSSTSMDRKSLEAVWKTPVPQKIKVFIWKLAQNGCPNQQITPPFNL